MNATVSLARCANYDKTRVSDAVQQVLDSVGGLASVVKPGMSVLIKPNLLSAKSPERAVTTHPVIVECVSEMVSDLGAGVLVGDSPAGAVRGVKRLWENTGMLSASDNGGFEMVNFETAGTSSRNVDGHAYHIARPALEADVVISLAKLKTHGLTLFTGAIKNTFGTIPGFGKGEMHKRFPDPTSFSERLVDVFSLIQPDITIMDGILGMEGNGPSSGSPREFGFVGASKDAVALDSVCSWIMGFNPAEIATTKIASRRGLGESDLSGIDVVGEPRDGVRQPDVTLPSNRAIRLIPPFVARAFGRFVWARPKANPDLCDSCGMCEKSCPVSCISMAAGIPDIDYSECINCLCCNETCPQGAMEIEMSRLAKRIG